MEYPVACTNQITDYKKALAIAKQVELDCARFVILASGLNPIVDRQHGDTIVAHLNSMISSFESYGLPCTIEPATTEFINAGRDYMNKYFSTELYQTYKDDDLYADSIGKSAEAIGTVNAFNDEGDDETVTDLNGNTSNYYEKALHDLMDKNHGLQSNLATFEEPTEENFKKMYYNLTGQQLKTPDEIQKDDDNKYVDLETARAEYNAVFNKYSDVMKQTKISDYDLSKNQEILGKLNKVGPTIVTITLYLTDGAGGQRAIQMPLAIKSSLQFLESPDLMRVLTGVENKTKKLDKFIKVTTGQMTFFKDWLAAISEVDEDIEREKALGTVPIFRRLMDARNRYRIKTIAETRPILSKFIAGKNQKDLPMCTIICTSSEMEEAFKQKWTYIYKTRKIINEIIDTYMLLGFGVVDTTSDIIYLFYAGEPEPQIIEVSKVGNGNDSADAVNKSLAEAIANTTRLMARH